MQESESIKQRDNEAENNTICYLYWQGSLNKTKQTRPKNPSSLTSEFWIKKQLNDNSEDTGATNPRKMSEASMN